MTENFVGDAVAQTTTDQTDPRMDYMDSIDVIFAMHREYMPIIREFRCYEDAKGKISGYEIDYHHKPVIKTRFLNEKFWKTVGRYGTSSQDTTKTLLATETNYISKVTATVGEIVEQLKLETINGDEVVCGSSSPVGTEMSIEGYFVSFDSHFRNNLVGLEAKFTTKEVGDEANMQMPPFRA